MWKLGEPYINQKLKPDAVRAMKTYQTLLSQGGVFAEGLYVDGKLTGAAIATTHENAFAKKSYATMDLWIGPVVLLDKVVKWWEGRPILRALLLQFPEDVRPGVYRILRSRGFERNGDMNILWR